MRKIYSIIFITALLFVFALTACAQSPRVQRIFQSCANSTLQAELRIEAGNIYLKPCPTKKAYYNNIEIGTGGSTPPGDGSSPETSISSLNGLTGATQTFLFGTNDTGSISSTGTVHTFNNPISAISGATRTGFFPYFDASNTLAKSYVQQATNQFNVFPANFSSGFTARFDQNLGSFLVGDNGTPNTNIGMHTGAAGSGFTSSIDLQGDLIRIGRFTSNNDVNILTDNGTNKTAAISANVFAVDNFTHTATLNFTGVSTFSLQKTITTGGTTGAQTINKPSGTVNLAAGANSVVVTNSTVGAGSIVTATARTNDATCGVKNVVTTSGSFTVNMSANCTAETSVGFLVTN